MSCSWAARGWGDVCGGVDSAVDLDAQVIAVAVNAGDSGCHVLRGLPSGRLG
jgi:hypothetical protein